MQLYRESENSSPALKQFLSTSSREQPFCSVSFQLSLHALTYKTSPKGKIATVGFELPSAGNRHPFNGSSSHCLSRKYLSKDSAHLLNLARTNKGLTTCISCRHQWMPDQPRIDLCL